MINFRFGVSERSFSAVMSLPAELILANRNLLFQFTYFIIVFYLRYILKCEERIMAVSYKKVWNLLIDKDMKKKDLLAKAHILT